MPPVKHPCTQCKEKHLKCDEQRPECRRCQLKVLPCMRPVKKTVFKHGSVARFSQDQKWVKSEARHFRYHARGRTAAREPRSPDQSACESWSTILTPADESRRASLAEEDKIIQHTPETSSAVSQKDVEDFLDPKALDATTSAPEVLHSDGFGSNYSSWNQPPVSLPNVEPPHIPLTGPMTSNLHASQHDYVPSATQGYGCRPTPTPTQTQTSNAVYPQSVGIERRVFPLKDVQEACLLRYWIEEISHWFDLCDESRHFHLVVPDRARDHTHLLCAIFAVSARHLSRLPQYKTSKGIVYHGQLLPDLDEHSAVEYMLQCIPALRQFHNVQDNDYRDSVVVTAVILRQLEEIDKEDEQFQLSGSSTCVPVESEKQVNFLAIIDAVLRSPPSQSVFGQRSLMQAAYWMALRQEIYHSFTRMEAPQLILPPEFWHIASSANKSVMHLVQVARWKWGDCSALEWSRLMDQQEHLENIVLADIQPLFKKPADKALGEIFPTVWYHSNIEVTSMQFSLLAKSVLVAENPKLRLDTASRSSWRQVENDVRLLLLEQSGIALCNPASPPALAHAAFGIQVYGDFFTDHYERRAIRMVVERYRDTHAWPVQQLLDMFR